MDCAATSQIKLTKPNANRMIDENNLDEDMEVQEPEEDMKVSMTDAQRIKSLQFPILDQKRRNKLSRCPFNSLKSCRSSSLFCMSLALY